MRKYIIGLFFTIVPISLSLYHIGINHGENNKNVEYLEKDKRYDSLKKNVLKFKDSIAKLNTTISSLKSKNNNDSEAKKNYTILVINNEPDKYRLIYWLQH
ncbi:hypothetical protein [Flavivirga jejuensis]|uniref:Uncharacterized protein n=1 Tax=Flavivirga jejuensis TaxID=870487 RepID=A0ABT8WQ41_9FLAO|nr:hypothetical protein [Flavivirga jejuensis]MDO5975261.1 hypothetical protein [Flavivirga jejuensis]